MGSNHSQWALYWTAHLDGGASAFPGPNGKISTTTSQTDNQHVDIKLGNDNDNDGVVDNDDHCSDTPVGEYVNRQHGNDHEGCGWSDYDYDGDNVKNGDDACPGTPEGEAVDETGCPVGQPQNTYTLTIDTSGTGSGTVNGAGSYDSGAVVTVEVTANAGSVLTWEGPNAVECATLSVTMDADKSCTAVFSAQTPADLVVSNFTVSPTPALVDQAVILTATISNNGAATATNFDVDLYQNLPSAPASGQVGNVTCNVSSLAGGESTSCSGTLTYSAVGTYTAWAQVDTKDEVSESDETNNAAKFDSAATGVSIAVCNPSSPIATSIDPSVIKNHTAVISAGTNILAHAVLAAYSKTGLCSFIGVGGSLAKYASIGANAVVSAGVAMGSHASLGDNSTLYDYVVAGGSSSIGLDSFVGYNVRIGTNATVGDYVILGNYALVGVGATVSNNSYIGNDSLVGEGASVGAGSYISDNSTVGKYTTLGSQSFVGTGTLMGTYNIVSDNVTIGNNITMGGSISIGTQSRIGDNALIGSNIHIGTNVTIGNNASISSQATVCDNAVVADGVTITIGELYGCN